MVSSINIGAYSDALVILGTAGIVIPTVRRWGINPVLGYLGAGALLGPLGLGSFLKLFPAIYWFTIVDAKKIDGIAELGIVFLLFLIGLEMSFERLKTMRRLVLGLGTAQVLVTTALLTGVLLAAHQPLAASIVLAASLSLSSTAIVLEILSNQRRLSSSVGRTSFAILLAQDINVIPLLMFVSMLGHSNRETVLHNLLAALFQAAIALTIIVIVGRLLLRPLFRLVASTHSRDLLIAAVLFTIVGSGVIAHQAGLSMSLGAFVAGLLLAETEYHKLIQTIVEPFKGLLLGIFFFTIGMNIDVREVLRTPLLLAACVVGLILLKSVVLTLLGRLFHLSWRTSIETGLLLGPGGEFAFVSVGMAASLGLIDSRLSSFVLAGTSITMALTPLLSLIAGHFRSALKIKKALDPELTVAPPITKGHAIVVGYGRVGKVVYETLQEHQIPAIAIDSDAVTVTNDRRNGHGVYFGDAANPEFLKACGLEEAVAVIITINTKDVIGEIVGDIRTLRPDVSIVSRARDAEHARQLYRAGVSVVVPETIEASLQLSESALLELGVAPDYASSSVDRKRFQFQQELLTAAEGVRRNYPRAED